MKLFAISNTFGKTKPNKAKTATTAITTNIIGYINAQIYLFFISFIYSYSCAKDSKTITRLPVFSQARTTL